MKDDQATKERLDAFIANGLIEFVDCRSRIESMEGLLDWLRQHLVNSAEQIYAEFPEYRAVGGTGFVETEQGMRKWLIEKGKL